MAHRVCPWWMGYVLVNPLRKLVQNPEKILSPYIRSGMTVMDVGCGMGYFSLDMAKLSGDKGKVVCVDLQERMINAVKKRSEKAGLKERIDTVVCLPDSLRLEGYSEQIDFAIAFYIVHEVPDARFFIEQMHRAIKPSGKLLVAEPKGHITESKFQKTIALICENGFKEVHGPAIFKSYVSLFERV